MLTGKGDAVIGPDRLCFFRNKFLWKDSQPWSKSVTLLHTSHPSREFLSTARHRRNRQPKDVTYCRIAIGEAHWVWPAVGRCHIKGNASSHWTVSRHPLTRSARLPNLLVFQIVVVSQRSPTLSRFLCNQARVPCSKRIVRTNQSHHT